MPESSGFADAPVTRALLFYLVAASLVVSVADVKDLVDLRVGGSRPAAYEGEESERWLLWVLERVWRLGIWQVGVRYSFGIFNLSVLLSLCIYQYNGF